MREREGESEEPNKTISDVYLLYLYQQQVVITKTKKTSKQTGVHSWLYCFILFKVTCVLLIELFKVERLC